MDSEKYKSIYNNAVKFQSMKFDDCEANVYPNINAIMSKGASWAEETDDVVYDAKNNKDASGSLFSPDWDGPHVTCGKTPFGGGASGSMAIRCTDENDPETYKVTGIYWGGMSGSEKGTWYFQPHFTPFVLNFGKNLDEDINWSIINSFFEQGSYPVNDQMYPAY